MSDRGGAIVTPALRTAFEQDTLTSAKAQSAKLIDVFRPRHPELADLMVRAEDDVLAYKTFPKSHWRQIHSTNPLERLNKEIKRRTNVVGIFPNGAAITRLVGALMLEQNDEWAVKPAPLRRQDLRRTAVVRLAEAGCDVPMIVSITGHKLRSATTILDTYHVKTTVQADAAITLLENHEKQGLQS